MHLKAAAAEQRHSHANIDRQKITGRAKKILLYSQSYLQRLLKR